MTGRLRDQLRFLVEIDRLKAVLRQSPLAARCWPPTCPKNLPARSTGGTSPERVHARRKRQAAEDRLDETRFAWRGLHSDTNAFCCRVHSPVMLLECDNHPGIFLDNGEPERFHVHTIVREPHGNDYGMDLLSQHYARHHTR